MCIFLKCLNVYLEVCKKTDDSRGMAIAYQKLALEHHALVLPKIRNSPIYVL